MKKKAGFMKNTAKRVVTMFMSICMLLGSVAGYGDVALAAEYDCEEKVIETGNLNKSGTTIINGKLVEGQVQTNLHEGIIRMLDDETEVVDSLIYGDNKYTNVHSVFSDSDIQINVGEAKLSNIIVAEGNVTINASMMRSDEYTIIYSKNGDIQFNVGQMDFSGVVYAPNGDVTFSASQVHMIGRIIASGVNIYAGVFEIDGLEEYSNIVDKLEFLTSDTILKITDSYDEENDIYSIDITSENKDIFDRLEVYTRYDSEVKFSYLCELSLFEEIGVADTYDTLDLVVKGTTKYNEEVYSDIKSFHMDEDEVLYAHIDTDEDGIADGEEILFTETNPYKSDSDEDGLSDNVECFYLFANPNSNTEDGDYDNDGLSNFAELEQGTSPFMADCDMDGLLDEEDSEPLVYNRTGVEPDYTSAYVTICRYDRIMNGCGEDGEIYQYIYNYLTDEVKAICYNDREIMYFYDVDSNMISDIRKYKNEYRVNSCKYDENGNVIAYSNNENIYRYTYDELGNLISASVNDKPIVVTSENEVIYGNGDIITTEVNDGGCACSINGEEMYLVENDSQLCIDKCLYKKTGIYYEYKYTEGYLDYFATNTGYKVDYSGDESEYIVNYTYNGENKEQTIYIDSEVNETILITGDVYKKVTADDSVSLNLADEDNAYYDVKYAFENGNITEVYYNDSKQLSYTYNDNSQITSIAKNNEIIWGYEYDLVGQLVAVYNYANKTVEKYSYDMYNNIKSVEKYAYDKGIGELICSDLYDYQSDDNTDRVTAFNGEDISYDEIGNPLTYYDGKAFNWSGRSLDSIKTSDECIEYAYDENGLRIQKNVNGKVTNFYYEGEDIIVEASDERAIWYIYDDSTNMLGFSYNGKDYYYVKNASKDVMAIVDDEGNYVCGYEYDTWGNILNIDGDEEIAKVNPIRYRSYYYDEESGFYYLKTRYYDSEIRRFISMDDVCDVAYEMVDPNLYAYCCNDPVNLYDPEGRAAINISIFSIPDSYSCVKEYLIDDLVDMSTSTVYMQHQLGSTNEHFINWWNNLESKEIVIIWAHGSPTMLSSSITNFEFGRSDIADNLDYKEIKLLVLIACNAGHFNFYDRNVALALARKISGVVIASDGTVRSEKYMYAGVEPYISLTSHSGGSFTTFLPINDDERDNLGWLIYDKRTKFPREVCEYVLDAELIHSLYIRRVWLSYK